MTGINFASTRTILDFDAVFIDSGGLKDQEPNSGAIDFRREEFLDFLQLGRTIVVFIGSLRLDEFFPIDEPVELKAFSGHKFEFKGPDYLKSFWQSVQPDMQYLARFENDSCPGKPFVFVPSTNRPVGTLVKHDRGNLLLLPWLRVDPNDPIGNMHSCERFTTAFKKLNEHLVPKKQKVELPAWSAQFGWERERLLRENLASLQIQSDEIAKNIGSAAVELEVEDKLKVLFTGTGDILATTVIAVFQELGIKANAGEPGRDDVIFEFEGRHAVIEVKGRKSSAAESDAAQLEKWVAGFMGEKGKAAKGILLVNAFCETPLTERTLAPFPNQMLKYSTQREHCLMTTTQLLGLLLDIRAHPEKRVDLVSSLFSTIGVYPEFSDWQTFLTAPTPPTAEKKK